MKYFLEGTNTVFGFQLGGMRNSINFIMKRKIWGRRGDEGGGLRDGVGLTQGFQGGKGKGGGEGYVYHPDLDERQFRRVEKFRGDKDKFKSWLYEVVTAIGVVNNKLQREAIDTKERDRH